MNASTEQSIIDEMLDLLKRVAQDIAKHGEVKLDTYSEVLALLKVYSNDEVLDGRVEIDRKCS